MLHRALSWLAISVLIVLASLSVIRVFLVGPALTDFHTFVASGQALSEGANPYAPELVPSATVLNRTHYRVNMNPPVTLLAFEPLSHVDPTTAFRLSGLASLVLYALGIGLLWRAYPHSMTPLRFAWLLAYAPLWGTVEQGQIWVLIGLATTLAWLLLRTKHPVWAGLLIGFVVAIKPNFVIWPALLVLTGGSVAAGVALVTAVLLSLAPVVVYGPAVYSQYLALILSEASVWPGMPGNASLPGLGARIGLPMLGVVASIALIALVLLLVRSRRPTLAAASDIGLALSLLASPLAWPPYMVVLLPAFFSRPWTRAMQLAAAVLVLPTWYVWQQAVTSDGFLSLALGSLHAIALLFVFAHLLAPSIPSSPSPPGNQSPDQAPPESAPELPSLSASEMP
jgi:hypothetical protein